MADQTQMALELLSRGVSGGTIASLVPLQKLDWGKISKISDNCDDPRAWLLFLLQNSTSTETLIDVLLKNKRVFSEELSLPKDNKVINPIILALMNKPTDQGWKAFENVTFFVAEQYRFGKPSQTFWAALKQMENQAPKKFAAMMSRITGINVYFSEECAKKNQSKDTKEAVDQKKKEEKIAEQLVKKVIQNEAGYVSLDGVDNS